MIKLDDIPSTVIIIIIFLAVSHSDASSAFPCLVAAAVVVGTIGIVDVPTRSD
jgi:hypothetical protein